MELLKRLIAEEEGQGLVEYTLILALIAVAVVAAVIAAGLPAKFTTIWSRVGSALG